MTTSTVQVRVEDDLKTKATELFDSLGMDLSTAVRLFLKRSVMVNGIPFPMILPKDTSQTSRAVQALYDSSADSKKNGLSEMTLEEINKEIDAVRSSK